MRLIKIKVPAGVAYELAAVGDYVRVRRSAVDLTIENRSSEVAEIIEVSEGDDFEFSEFSALRISHDSLVDQEVRLIISKGKRAGSSQVGGNIAISNFPAQVAVNGAFTSTQKTVTNASASLLAANPARRYLLIQNNSATGDIYINLAGAAATTANSIKIAAGGSYELQGFVNTGQIFAIGSIASNANVVVVEG